MLTTWFLGGDAIPTILTTPASIFCNRFALQFFTNKDWKEWLEKRLS
jgi:hypothetical protein